MPGQRPLSPPSMPPRPPSRSSRPASPAGPARCRRHHRAARRAARRGPASAAGRPRSGRRPAPGPLGVSMLMIWGRNAASSGSSAAMSSPLLADSRWTSSRPSAAPSCCGSTGWFGPVADPRVDRAAHAGALELADQAVEPALVLDRLGQSPSFGGSSAAGRTAVAGAPSSLLEIVHGRSSPAWRECASDDDGTPASAVVGLDVDRPRRGRVRRRQLAGRLRAGPTPRS